MFGKIKRLCDAGAHLEMNEVMSSVFSNSNVDAEVQKINDDQLEHGERADGSLLPDYSATSVLVYGKVPGPMTLKDTGDFRANIYVQAQPDTVQIKDSDWKTDMLQKRYGVNILVIQSRLPELRQFIKPFLLKEIRFKLFKK